MLLCSWPVRNCVSVGLGGNRVLQKIKLHFGEAVCKHVQASGAKEECLPYGLIGSFLVVIGIRVNDRLFNFLLEVD